MRKSISLTGLAMLIWGGNAFAQQGQAQETVLETITVTAPFRREGSISAATSSVTVIDEETIRATPVSDVASLLQSYAGVTISHFGGLGSNAEVSLRGVSPSQTLVLINGVRASSATSGTTSIFNIPLSAVSRIEIAKGPHSAQYGSDAIGGVINIITKDGADCPDGKDRCSTVTVGVDHPWGGHSRIDTRGKTDGGLSYAFGGGLLGTRGYDFTTPTAWGHESDDDGFLQGSFDARLSQDFDWGRFYADGLYARGASQFDASPDSNETVTATFAGKVGARVDHADDWFSRVELSSSSDNAKSHRDGVSGQEEYETVRTGILATTQKTVEAGGAQHVFSAGVEAYREWIDTNVLTYDVRERTLVGLFGQYALEIGAFNLDAGLRHDYNEQFGEATTYNVGARYELVSGVSARVSYATGFRAPTFNDLYYPGWSNPNLRPEHSRSIEAGLLWELGQDTNLEVSLYKTWISDAIALDAAWIPYNTGRVEIRGVEAAMNHRFNEAWSVRGSLDLREPLNKDTGKYMANRERFKASFETMFTPTEKLTLSASLLYGGSRYANADNTTKLSDYVTMDFSAIYIVDDRSRWKLGVINAFDAEYSTRADFKAPGRTVNLSFTREF